VGRRCRAALAIFNHTEADRQVRPTSPTRGCE